MKQEQPTNYKYHSTGQYRNVVNLIKNKTSFVGLDEDGEALYDKTKKSPELEYVGTVKLHGTNGSVVLHEDNTISFHSKNNILGYIKDEEFTLLSDNSEFAQSMYRRLESVKEVVGNAVDIVKNSYGEDVRPIKTSGEWAGQGVQRGVGISFLPKKSFFIFGIKVGETDSNTKRGWLSPTVLDGIASETTRSDGIYSITDFPTKKLVIDFSNPEFSQNALVDFTNEVENCCPVSYQLGLKDADGKPAVLGEGLVWTPLSEEHCWDSGTWFKTKGKKHSVSKTKSVAAIDPEKLNSIKEFVDYAVTTNRLMQGLVEVGLDQKLVGNFIGWVNRDVNKEEGDVLEANNLSMKDVGKYVSNKAREFYLEQLNKVM